MQVGMTKDQGFYNKPSAAVHPGALAADTLLQYNTIQYNVCMYVCVCVYACMYIYHYFLNSSIFT